ncbi:MAG: sensor histidine kinase [Bryobacterales bacterium]|nr:sensor histidine kinase [Bryobacterales bacterium]
MIDIPSTRAIHRKARMVLLLGFCALLLLVAAIGIYAARTVERLSNDEVAEVARQSLRRNLLKQADESLTAATTAVRDCLMGLDESAAEPHRKQARQAWQDAENAIAKYREAAGDHAALTGRLTNELTLYWALAETTIQLDQKSRRTAATTVFVDQLVPLRDQFLNTLEELQRLEWQDLRSVAEQSDAIAGKARRRMWAGVGGACLLAALIVAFSFWHLKSLETSAISNYAEAATAAVELSNLSGRLFRSQEEERKRIAREIHDDFGQRMATLLYELSSLSERKDATQPMSAAIEGARERLAELAKDIQNLSRGLHSAVLEKIGLVAAIRSDCALIAHRTHLEVNFESTGSYPRLPEEIALPVYRVYQEAMQNVIKHAKAGRADVSLSVENAHLTLRVKDYGIGFETSSLSSQTSLGLVTMRERLRIAGGKLRVHSTPSRGTEIEASVPLPDA